MKISHAIESHLTKGPFYVLELLTYALIDKGYPCLFSDVRFCKISTYPLSRRFLVMAKFSLISLS